MINRTTKISVVLLLIILLGILHVNNQPSKESTRGSISQVLAGNAIYVDDLPPGGFVPISYVNLQANGFVVIQKDTSDKPGKVFGVSEFLRAGQNTDIPPISLLQHSKDKERYFAILYLDDGDGVFDSEGDMPVIDPITGEKVMMIFNVAKDSKDSSTKNSTDS